MLLSRLPLITGVKPDYALVVRTSTVIPSHTLPLSLWHGRDLSFFENLRHLFEYNVVETPFVLKVRRGKKKT